MIHNRTRAKAEELAAAVSAAYPQVPVSVGAAEPDGCEIVVNTTSAGLHDSDPLPINRDFLVPGLLVAEIIMIPERTALLESALERGCKIQFGRHMLDKQIDLIGGFLRCFQ